MKKLSLSLAVAAIAGLATVANAALADGGAKFLGNITTGGQIRSDFAQYWNQITPENGCKWGSIHSHFQRQQRYKQVRLGQLRQVRKRLQVGQGKAR